jgi:hypothetical protein
MNKYPIALSLRFGGQIDLNRLRPMPSPNEAEAKEEEGRLIA